VFNVGEEVLRALWLVRLSLQVDLS
jgi:hypothetical protein